jgi:hypothetical protein
MKLSSKPSPVKKTRRDKGRVLMTPRDMWVLEWIGDSFAARLDQVCELMSRDPQKPMLRRTLSYSTVVGRVHRWQLAGWIDYQRILATGPGWVYLTRKGLDAVGLEYKAKMPAWKTLDHVFAVNEVRLTTEWAYWTSERWIRTNWKKDKYEEIPDAIIQDAHNGPDIAIEVEISYKAPEILEQKLRRLVRSYKHPYSEIRFYVPNEERSAAINRAAQKAMFSEEDWDRLSVFVVDLDPTKTWFDDE